MGTCWWSHTKVTLRHSRLSSKLPSPPGLPSPLVADLFTGACPTGNLVVILPFANLVQRLLGPCLDFVVTSHLASSSTPGHPIYNYKVHLPWTSQHLGLNFSPLQNGEDKTDFLNLDKIVCVTLLGSHQMLRECSCSLVLFQVPISLEVYLLLELAGQVHNR